MLTSSTSGLGKKILEVCDRNWERTKQILFNDLRSKERRKIENAVYTFISLGSEELIEDLISILNSKGNKEMAETYLNCGHKRLDAAAREWATRRGYYISVGPGASKASWGS
jgi:hypothetical protein